MALHKMIAEWPWRFYFFLLISGWVGFLMLLVVLVIPGKEVDSGILKVAGIIQLIGLGLFILINFVIYLAVRFHTRMRKTFGWILVIGYILLGCYGLFTFYIQHEYETKYSPLDATQIVLLLKECRIKSVTQDNEAWSTIHFTSGESRSALQGDIRSAQEEAGDTECSNFSDDLSN